MFLLATEAFSALSTFKKCGTVFLYITLALIAVIIIIGFIVNSVNKEKLKLFSQYSIGICIGYSIALIGIMLFLKFDEMIALGEFSGKIFWPVFALLLLMILLSIGGLIISILKKPLLKAYTITSIIIIVCYVLVLSIIQLSKIYESNFILKDELGLIISLILLAAIVAVILFIFDKKPPLENNTKSVVYAAICIAMSFALSYIRFFKLPQGGSITFVSLLPLMLYSHMFGIRKGVLAGFIYGLMQAIQDPWIIHPIQFLLDYPIAFAMIGLSGLFKVFTSLKDKRILQFVLGAVFACTMRYICHVITGIIVFGSYAAEGFNAVSWGFVYNLFVFVDAAIVIFAGILLLSSKYFVKQIETINP